VALIRYLQGAKTSRPTRIDTPPTKSTEESIIESGFGAGTLTLAGATREFTLVWKLGDEQGRRALPAGAYGLRTIRVEKLQGKQPWFISSTGPTLPAKTYAAGESQVFAFDATIRFAGQARTGKHGHLQLGFQIQAPDDRGLSVYRGDKRVPVTFRVLDAKQKELASGTMNYG